MTKPGKGERKSIVLITVDCLRADHCGFMGYSRATTPFLNSLAGESLVFPRALVAGVPTYYSFPAIMASRYSLAMGREVLGLAVEEKSLASTLKENGYATAFFGAGNPYISAGFGYDFGFEIFCDFLDNERTFIPDRPTERSTWGGKVNRALAEVSHRIPGMSAAYDELYFHYCQRWAAPPQSWNALRRFPTADVIVDRAQNWLGSVGERPFFLWLHMMDPHSPYYPKEQALEMVGAGRLTAERARYVNHAWNRFDIGSNRLRRYRDEIIGMYDAGICWVDAQLARLTQSLRELKLWDNCLLAFTADHGEEFLEHEGRYHAPALSEELIQVPLLVRVPGIAKRKVCGNPFSLIHLAPTLLDAVDSAIPAEFQGQSHWAKIRQGGSWDEVAIAECVAGCTNPFRIEQRRASRLLAIRDSRYKLILNFATNAEHLFDLEADPGEHAPLSKKEAIPERRRLLEIAATHLKNSVHARNSEVYLRTRLRDVSARAAGVRPYAGEQVLPDAASLIG